MRQCVCIEIVLLLDHNGIANQRHEYGKCNRAPVIEDDGGTRVVTRSVAQFRPSATLLARHFWLSIRTIGQAAGPFLRPYTQVAQRIASEVQFEIPTRTGTAWPCTREIHQQR